MKNKILASAAFLLMLGLAITGCKKLARPALGDFPKDSNPPGGPLKFYAAFDGTTANPLMNAVDSIRANFPSDNPLSSIPGISGQAVMGNSVDFIKYPGANDFIASAQSFTISFWEKRDGSPNGNASFAFTFPSSNKNWGSYGFSMFLLFDWGTPNDSAIVKLYMADVNKSDHWFEWTGANRIKGIQDNQWHHIALVYDSGASSLTLYADGVPSSNVPTWGSHGAANMDASKVSEFDIGGNKNIKDMGWGMNWDGGLDQFRLYSIALSPAEVSALYAGKM